MAAQSARGTRDFLPTDMTRRNRVLGTIREVFERYGFEPLETPAIERIETLMGKYGDEGDKLLFRILKRGEGSERGEADMGLRYDLTVPLARVVAMHHAALPQPFKRYQIQPVWRADRPQRGRFREFFQCDVDVVGTASLVADAELVAIVHEALSALGFSGYRIRVNHRGVLRGMIEAMGVAPEREGDVLVALDKLDKVGRDGVRAELLARGLGERVADRVDALAASVGVADGLDVMRDLATATEAGASGVRDLEALAAHLQAFAVPAGVVAFDPTLARGLSYYTGPIFEATLEGFPGSISGGGRYDELVGMFLGRRLPSTGISLGVERLLAIMEERGMLAGVRTSTELLVTVWGTDMRPDAIRVATALRAVGLRADLYPDDDKLKKQLKYADSRGIRHAVIQGPDERDRGVIAVKDLQTGAQSEVALDALADALVPLVRSVI
ncbi:MAG: histidine--tRNA ligase [Myxococcales bacterium]